MDTWATEHMYSNRGEKRSLDTLFSSWKSTSSMWSFFSEAQGLLEIVMIKAGFLPWLSSVTLDNTSRCVQGVGSRQTGATLPELWGCGPEPASIWDPYAQVSPCWQRSSASGDSRYYLSDSSSRSYCPSSKAHTHGQAHSCVLAIQLPFLYLSVCLPLVGLKLRCWTVKWSSWCTSTSAEPDVGAVISGISIKQTAGGSKVWRGHN